MDVRRTLALALVVPLFLAGCSEDEPEPKMPDPTPTSSEPSPSPTQSETAEVESAEDFIRRWQAAGDEMQVTGETAEYLAISPRCAACKSLAANVDEIYEGGGSIEFSGSDVVSVDRTEQQPPTFEVALSVPETVVKRPGGASEKLPAGEMRIRVTLGRQSGDWHVTHYGVL